MGEHDLMRKRIIKHDITLYNDYLTCRDDRFFVLAIVICLSLLLVFYSYLKFKRKLIDVILVAI